MNEPLLHAREVTVDYGTSKKRRYRAVDGVSLTLDAGESLGVVGESGSGKTSLVSAMLGIVPLAAGEVLISGKAANPATRTKLQMVYQDPTSSLNPRMRIGRMLSGVLRAQRPDLSRPKRQQRAEELLDQVGLSRSAHSRLPGELSGGQRQRAGIARALAAEPRVLILDEAVAALDLSVQASVLATIQQLQGALGFAVLFISHDLAVIRNTCDRVMVMKSGVVVERGTVESVFARPSHSYTRELLASTPEVRTTSSVR